MYLVLIAGLPATGKSGFAEYAGKALVSLEALRELGLVERRGARWMPAAVSGKKDLTSAPILRRMAAMAAQENQERG